MRYKQYSDVKDFYTDVYEALMRDEAQNLILLGNLVMGCAGADKHGWRDPAGWLMEAVFDGPALRLVALMTPPYNLTLYEVESDDAALACLAAGIRESGSTIPGVMAEKSLAMRFAHVYSQRHKIEQEQRIYELTSVNPDIPLVGTIRPVRESDLSFLPYWLACFHMDCFGGHLPDLEDEAENARSRMEQGTDYILEVDGAAVSMASMHRAIQSVCGVGYVYTPPYFRGKGYATSCVAQVSRLILERGFAKCVLYTDLANPTSNSIYQKIGYAPICDSSVIPL